MQKIYKYLITLFGFVAVLYPLFERARVMSMPTNSTGWILAIFPFLGLAAVAMLWLHAMSGVFEPWLRNHINFDRFVDISAMLIFICFVLHPILLLLAMDFNFGDIFVYYGKLSIWLGIASWLLLILYDITKPFKKKGFFSTHWQKVLLISNLGFLLSFVHALLVGSDLQGGPLRWVWIFYGITGTLAIIYTYAVMPFLPKKQR